MRAEKARRALTRLRRLGQDISLVEPFDELTEMERLSRIGEAVEWAISQDVHFIDYTCWDSGEMSLEHYKTKLTERHIEKVILMREEDLARSGIRYICKRELKILTGVGEGRKPGDTRWKRIYVGEVWTRNIARSHKLIQLDRGDSHIEIPYNLLEDFFEREELDGWKMP